MTKKVKAINATMPLYDYFITGSEKDLLQGTFHIAFSVIKRHKITAKSENIIKIWEYASYDVMQAKKQYEYTDNIQETANGIGKDLLQVLFLSILENKKDGYRKTYITCMKDVEKYIYSSINKASATLYIEKPHFNGENTSIDLTDMVQKRQVQRDIRKLYTCLNDKEKEVYNLLADGYTLANIEEVTEYSRQNIRTIRKNIQKKILEMGIR